MRAHERRRKTNGQIAGRHSVLGVVLLHTIEVEDQRAQGGVVRVGEFVNDGVDGVAALCVVFEAGGVDEAVVGAAGQEGVGQLAEELLEEAGYAVDVVVEGCWVPEVD